MAITPRSLFNIVLKIFGLFFLREIINQIPSTVAVFISYFSGSDYSSSIGMFIVSILILCFYIFLVLQLLFKTNIIIDALKLDKGFLEHEFSFDEKPENKIQLTTKDVMLIALIIIGGYILVEEIPNFCRQAYLFIEQRKSLLYGSSSPSGSNAIVPASKILLGLLILGERKRIVDFFENKTKVDNEEGV